MIMSVFSDCISNINRKKRLYESDSSNNFQRCLGIVDLTFIGLGAMIGTGLFVVGGEVAKNIAGPAVVVSFALGAFAAMMSASCYAEFSSVVAKTGSAYIYTYVSIGEVWAFIIGWNMLLEYIAMLSSVARAISATIDSVIDFKIQNTIIEHLLDGKAWKSTIFSEYPDLLAGVLILVVTILVSFGARISSTVTIICISVLFVILLVITVVSFDFGDIQNWKTNKGYFPFGIGGVLQGAAVCFITYSGFEVICISSEECSTPKKSIPIALAFALGIVSVTYMVVSASLTYMVYYKDILPEAAFSEAFIENGLEWMGYIVTVGIILAGVSTLITALYFLSRLIYALSVDGLFFKTFSTVNGTTQVPVKATIFFGLLSTLLSVFFKYEVLVMFLSIGTLCAYTIMAGAVIVLRYRPKYDDQASLCVDNRDATTHIRYHDFSEYTTDNFDENNCVFDEAGSLRNSFKGFPILRTCQPGAVVPCALLTYVLFSGTGMLIINNVPDLLSSAILTILVIILFIISILSFAIIPLHKHSVTEGQIQVPFVPYLPIFSITLNVVLMTQLDKLTWLRFIVWIAIGLVIYATYGYWHSEERQASNFPSEHCIRHSENGSTTYLYGSLEVERLQPRDNIR